MHSLKAPLSISTPSGVVITLCHTRLPLASRPARLGIIDLPVGVIARVVNVIGKNVAYRVHADHFVSLELVQGVHVDFEVVFHPGVDQAGQPVRLPVVDGNQEPLPVGDGHVLLHSLE